MTDYLDIVHRDVRTEHRMNFPHRRIRYSDSFDENTLATVGLDELRSEEMSRAENSFAHRNRLLSHLEKHSSILKLIRIPILPAVFGAPNPRPPGFRTGLTVECSRAGDGDVLLLEGIDKW